MSKHIYHCCATCRSAGGEEYFDGILSWDVKIQDYNEYSILKEKIMKKASMADITITSLSYLGVKEE